MVQSSRILVGQADGVQDSDHSKNVKLMPRMSRQTCLMLHLIFEPAGQLWMIISLYWWQHLIEYWCLLQQRVIMPRSRKHGMDWRGKQYPPRPPLLGTQAGEEHEHLQSKLMQKGAIMKYYGAPGLQSRACQR